MIKALPDMIPDDSIHDAVTQDVGKQILKTIKDHVFIARIFLLDKISNPVSVLEKNITKHGFWAIGISEN